MKTTVKTTILVCLFFAICAIFAYQNRPYENRQIEYTIKQGDTLWSIAEENKQENQDIRKYIYYIQNDNGTDNCIYVGQKLNLR